MAYRMPRLPELVGQKETIEVLGVQKMTFKRWRDSGHFDVPCQELGSGPVWVRADVETWSAEKGGRRRPGPAPAAAS